MTSAADLIGELRPVIRDERVLEAIAGVPRTAFVEQASRNRAWDNVALPIACAQTISQPLVVARMLETLRLRGNEHVLDVGTGSGYHAALLARLAGHVFTIERHAQLSQRAAAACGGLGIDNITYAIGDGSAGWPAHSPYDAINIAAAGRELPQVLLGQLAADGRMVLPLGGEEQHLVLITRTHEGFERVDLEPVRFVPLVSGAAEAD